MQQRSLYLPAAGAWFDFESDEVYEGGQEINLNAPLERIPVLVRDGSILPILSQEGLELHLYAHLPGAAGGEGVLYSDAGDGYGPWRVDRFHFSPISGGYELSCDSEGEFPWPYGPIQLRLHGAGSVTAAFNL